MTCREIKARLPLFLDGVLDGREAQDVLGHLEVCASCRAEAEAIRRFEDGLRAAAGQEVPVPPALARRIDAALAPRPWPVLGRRRLLQGAGVAAAASLAALAAVAVLRRPPPPPETPPAWVLEAPVNDLRTFLDSRRALDIATADPALLRRWFEGKTDFPPPKAAASAELVLVGGRLCYFLHRRASAYMYRADGRYVSFFTFPGAGLWRPESPGRDAGARTLVVREIDGFTHVLWSDGELIHSLVSDLPPRRLARLALELLPGA